MVSLHRGVSTLRMRRFSREIHHHHHSQPARNLHVLELQESSTENKSYLYNNEVTLADANYSLQDDIFWKYLRPVWPVCSLCASVSWMG